jgi:hypothetical protein
MKKIDLGQTVTILANLGVIAGIVFLAVELRQNNAFLQAQAGYALSQNRAANNDLLKSSPEFAGLLVKLERGEQLTPEEEYQEHGIYMSFFTNWAWEYGEYRANRLTDAQLPVTVWRALANGHGPIPTPRIRETWESSKAYLNSEFVEFMEAEIFDE